MGKVANLFLKGLRDTGFALASPERLAVENNTVVNLLNKAWKLFWENPEAFMEWEGRIVKKLKTGF